MWLLFFFISLSSAWGQSSSSGTYSLLDSVRTDQINLNLNQLRTGRPTITGLPTYQNGIVSSGPITGTSNGGLSLVNASGQYGIFVDTNGFVGIDTGVPKGLLDIGGNAAVSLPKVPKILLSDYANDGGARTWSIANAYGGSNFGTLGFHVSPARAGIPADNASMVITRQENVGIGIVSPGQKLDVVGNIKSTGTIFVGRPDTFTSSTGQGNIWFDSTKNKFLKSENGGAAMPMVDPLVNTSSNTVITLDSSNGYETVFTTSSTSGILQSVLWKNTGNGGNEVLNIYIDGNKVLTSTIVFNAANVFSLNSSGFWQNSGANANLTSGTQIFSATNTLSGYVGWGFKSSLVINADAGTGAGGQVSVRLGSYQ